MRNASRVFHRAVGRLANCRRRLVRLRHGDSLGPDGTGHARLRAAPTLAAPARCGRPGRARPPGRRRPRELRLRPRGGAGHPHAGPGPGPAGRPGPGAAHPGLPGGAAAPRRYGGEGRAALAARAGLRGRRVAGAAAAARRCRGNAGRAVAAGVAGGGAQGRGGRGGTRRVPGAAGMAHGDAGLGRLPDHHGGGEGGPAARRPSWRPGTRSPTSSSCRWPAASGTRARSSNSSG